MYGPFAKGVFAGRAPAATRRAAFGGCFKSVYTRGSTRFSAGRPKELGSMRRSHSTTRFALVLALALLTLSASACYKNAGENVQPTSNRVDLSDLQTPTVAATEGPVPVGTGDADVTQEAADPEAQPGG